MAENKGKERITIGLDADVLAWFRAQVQGGGNYQTFINDTLRAAMNTEDARSRCVSCVRCCAKNCTKPETASHPEGASYGADPSSRKPRHDTAITYTPEQPSLSVI
ncbi:hypothetical protein HDE80_004483 [Rhodanobacter sp. A1T4]|nr:BrnA antitoxin family protein [Rhodanobacter sp. A1T4]MBB6249406.1 hypothetical protein [Rhodanobacter sp. A1T4]